MDEGNGRRINEWKRAEKRERERKYTKKEEGVKRSDREADRLPLTSAEIKKTWIYTSTPPYVFMA
jgi:hypothetical protein